MKRILIFLMAAVMMAAVAEARTFALVVGISNYNDPEADVQWTTASAKNFAKLLKSQTKDVSVLTGRNASAQNILDKLTAISNRAQSGDRIILFYSGHGLPGGLYTFNGVLPYNDIISVLSRSGAKEKYCFIEACHSGTAAQAHPNADSANDAGITFFTGCRPDESSYVDPNIGAGVFSQALIKGLRGKADANLDKKVSVIELFKYAYNDVVQRKKSAQHPQLIGPGSMHDNILFTW